MRSSVISRRIPRPCRSDNLLRFVLFHPDAGSVLGEHTRRTGACRCWRTARGPGAARAGRRDCSRSAGRSPRSRLWRRPTVRACRTGCVRSVRVPSQQDGPVRPLWHPDPRWGSTYCRIVCDTPKYFGTWDTRHLTFVLREPPGPRPAAPDGAAPRQGPADNCAPCPPSRPDRTRVRWSRSPVRQPVAAQAAPPPVVRADLAPQPRPGRGADRSQVRRLSVIRAAKGGDRSALGRPEAPDSGHASCLQFLRYSCGHDATTCSGGEEGRGQRGHGQPGAQRQARSLRFHPAGGALRAGRPRLRAADPAARRARAPGRAWSCPSCRTRSSPPSPR